MQRKSTLMIWLPPTRVISRSCSTAEIGLRLQRNVAISSRKTVPPSAISNCLLASTGRRERALFMAEKFAFQNRLRQSAAVNDDQG